VGFDARWYNDSGVGTYVATLVRSIICERPDFEFFVYESPRNPIPGISSNHSSVSRVAVEAPRYSLAEQLQFRRRSAEDRLDVLHVPFQLPPLFVPARVVVTVHDLIPFKFRIYPSPKQQMIKAACRLSVSRSAHIIADSHNTANDVQQLLHAPTSKITTVHLAASSDEFHHCSYSPEPNYLKQKWGITAPYVLFAGANNWRTKNLATAIKAVSIARQQSRTSFQAVAYGPTQGIAGLPEAVCEQVNLITTGFVSTADLGMLYRNAHVFLMTSLYEGFGLPVLEAMACGCAVITSNGGSLAEVAGDGAQVFAPIDAEGMAHAIAELLSHPDTLQMWKQRALCRAAKFSWAKAARETIAVYHRVFQEKGARNSQ
jgi:glycosyltransferase involved in cell wall biosynthesis